MPKAFNLLNKTKENKENKKVKHKIREPKPLITVSTVTEPKKRGRKKKEETVVTKPIKKEKINKVKKEIKPISKKANVDNKSTNEKIKVTTSSRKWHNILTNPPEENRPIEINTNNEKQPAYGYKTYKGIITNNPYYIDKYKKATGIIEWQYISGCSSLTNCPNLCPNCHYCDIYIKRQKELKKNA